MPEHPGKGAAVFLCKIMRRFAAKALYSAIYFRRTIPILAMTANAFLEDMQKSKEAGMDAHLSKPVDIAALEQTVKRFRVTPPN